MLFKFARNLNWFVRSLFVWNMGNKALLFTCLALLSWLVIGITLPWTLTALFVVYLATGGYSFLYIAAKTCRRDFR